LRVRIQQQRTDGSQENANGVWQHGGSDGRGNGPVTFAVGAVDPSPSRGAYRILRGMMKWRPPPLRNHMLQRACSRVLVVAIALWSPQLRAQTAPAAAPRPQLRILNGSTEPARVFWCQGEQERVDNGRIEPGGHRDITTTLGHRFVVVGADSGRELEVTVQVPVQAFRFDPPSPTGVPAFYTQSVSANGFPITASARVNPYALKEAAWLVDSMLAHRPDVRAAMIASGARLCILAHDEFTTDLPEWAWLAEVPEPGFDGIAARDFRDARARGMGGSATDPFCSCAEENLLGYPGDPYATECILIHEFAHNIHLRGMNNIDPTFDVRVQAAWQQALRAGLWRGKYASTSHREYFAEGVQSWFDDNRENDHDHNHVDTRAELIEYDPKLAALCREVFGDTVLQYTKPASRLRDHLQGYEPAKAPTFVWPERLRAAQRRIHEQATARDRKARGAEKQGERRQDREQ
jgi:hypothetical protein